MLKQFYIFVFLCLSIQNYAQTISLKVLDAAEGQAIDFYSVLVVQNADTIHIPHDGSALTQVPLHIYPVEIIIQALGYESETRILDQKPPDSEILIFNLPKKVILEYTIVQALGTSLVRSLGTYQIARDEALLLPAAFFDPARAASTRPGVVQTNDGTNALSIHGLHPELLRWRLHGLEIVNPNHLPNAGTLSDRSAQGAGGVFLVSSQALGASQLHTGAMSAGVGDAVAGVMDLTLRDGDAQLRRTFQAGLLGIDAAISGKIKQDNLRYLVNYRYSTVGILSKLGVSFGDEAIAFQDLNAHLVYQGLGGGTLRAFAIAGQSTNALRGDTSMSPITLRSYSDINFMSQSTILGVHWVVPFAEGWHIETGSAWSGQLNNRDEQVRIIGAPYRTDRDEQERLSGNLIARKLYVGHGTSQFSMGVIGSHLRLRQISDSTLRTDLRALTLQPFASWQWSGYLSKMGNMANEHFTINLGLHNLYEAVNQSFVPQPRAQVTWRPNHASLQYALASGRYAQMPIWTSYGLPQNTKLRNALTPMTAWHHTISANYKYYHFRANTARVALFCQQLANIPVESATGFRSVIEGEPLRSISENKATGRSYGADLSVGIERTTDFRYEANLSLFRTQFRNQNVVFNARYSTGAVSNLLLERSWKKEKTKGKLTRSVAMRFVVSGGQNLTPVQVLASQIDYGTQYDYRNFSSKRGRAYYRTDIRFQRKMERKQQKIGTFAFEIQNISLRKNDDFEYYDTVTSSVLKKTQLGLIPNLNWRYEW
jgi:hypothetical protein